MSTIEANTRMVAAMNEPHAPLLDRLQQVNVIMVAKEIPTQDAVRNFIF